MPHVIYNCVRNIIEKIRGKTSPLRKWLRLTEEVCSTVYSEYLDSLRFHWVFFNTIYTMDFYYSSKCLRYMHRNSYTDAIVRSFISSCDCFESVGYAKMLTRVIVYTCVTKYVSPYPTSNFLNCFFGKTILSDQDAMISCSISLSFISCFL